VLDEVKSWCWRLLLSSELMPSNFCDWARSIGDDEAPLVPAGGVEVNAERAAVLCCFKLASTAPGEPPVLDGAAVLPPRDPATPDATTGGVRARLPLAVAVAELLVRYGLERSGLPGAIPCNAFAEEVWLGSVCATSVDPGAAALLSGDEAGVCGLRPVLARGPRLALCAGLN